MLPLIGGFIVSLAGSFFGKAIANAWEASKTEAAKTSASGATGPFASVLAQETQRLAQSPGATATDAPAATPSLSPARPRFLEESQAP